MKLGICINLLQRGGGGGPGERGEVKAKKQPQIYLKVPEFVQKVFS